MIDAARAAEPAFDGLARRLQPRAVAPSLLGLAPAAADGEAVTVRFSPAGLSAEARRALVALPSAVVRAGRGALGESELTCSRAELASLATTQPAARALLFAHDAARAPIDPPRIMGIVNVTPDSFSDGGRYLSPERAAAHALTLEAEGADLLDIGGESTRPGAAPVPVEEELRRVIPVVAAVSARSRLPLSVDTTKAEVARQAVAAGATIVNDVSAGRADPAMLRLVGELGVEYVAMHMLGTPRDMQRDPVYADPTAEVCAFLRERTHACLLAGISVHKIVLDPGIGFGKRLHHNLDLLRRLGELRSLGRPILLGVSRKSFIADAVGASGAASGAGGGEVGGSGSGGRGAGSMAGMGVGDSRSGSVVAGSTPDGVEARSGGTAASVAAGVLGGAAILRVHDVAVMREAAAVAHAIAHATPRTGAHEPLTAPAPASPTQR